MKVLLLSLFHPELVRGGAQQVCYELFQGLQAHPGVDPVLLAAVDQSLPSLFKSGARITGFDRRPNEYLFLSREYDYAWHKAGNTLLIESYAEFLELVRPDVVHIHHFLLFGIDILTLTRKVLPEARIIFTFHEFLSICSANGHMLRRTDGSLCTRPSSVRCHQCLPERPPEEYFVREMWFKRHLASADHFTTPTRFMIDHFVEWGIDRQKISAVTNGQQDYSTGKTFQEEYRKRRSRFGFFGQMVDNKGIWVVLEAVAQLRAEGFTEFTVELNGDNLRYASDERREQIEKFLEDEKRLPIEQRIVTFNGSYHTDQLAQRMARVDWCLVPSVWWETFALVISEAWMFKRPVIASNIGAMRERITTEVDGLLFHAGDALSLAQTIRRAATDEALWHRLVAGIKPPPPREAMVAGFLGVYARDRGSPAAGVESS